MDLELHLGIWNTLSEHIIVTDQADAAEDFIRILIEHGADAEDIAEFAIDEHIKDALSEYIELDEDEEFDELDEDEEFDFG